PGDCCSIARGVSADGSVIVGESAVGFTTEKHAFRWTASSGITSLGFLPGGFESVAFDVSADGTTAVGSATVGNNNNHAFRWTAATGLQDLHSNATGSSEAFAVNADGSVIVGQSLGAQGAVRWTKAGMQSVQFLL